MPMYTTVTLDGHRALVVTGEDQIESEARALLDKVIQTELDNWVPGTSELLIHRAASALGFKVGTKEEAEAAQARIDADRAAARAEIQKPSP